MEEQMVYGAPLGPRVMSVSPMDGYRLLLGFSNGEQRVFDAKPLLEYSVFEPLREEAFFKSVRVEFGTIMWPEDLDYCPDTLYLESAPYNS